MSISKSGSRSRIFWLLCGLVCLAVPLSAQSVTFSGRVTDQSSGQGIPDVAIVAQGNYTLPFGSSSNIRLRPYRSQYVFNPALIGFFSPGGFPIVGSIHQDFT